MITILDRYIGKTLLATTALSLAILLALSTLIRFVEQLRSIGRGTYGLVDVIYFSLLSIPRDIEIFFPMAALLGGLIGMGMLANQSELIVMQAAGLSKTRIVRSVMKASIIMMIFVLALGEWVAPDTEAKARQLRAQSVSGGALISAPHGVWARDKNSFIHIGEIEDTGLLANVSIYDFDRGRLKQVMHAKTARYQEPIWLVEQVKRTTMGDVSLFNQELDTWTWETELTPDKLGIVIVKPESLSISGLYKYVHYLEGNKQNTSRYELAFWRKALMPMTVAVMLLVALSFIFGPLRSVTMGARIFLGVITGFGFHMVNEVFGPISHVYAIPPLAGALLPSLLFAAVALHFLTRKNIH